MEALDGSPGDERREGLMRKRSVAKRTAVGDLKWTRHGEVAQRMSLEQPDHEID